ncbi:MAG: adenosylcobinamide amidohydrolase [Methanobrevibacter ruminantium]|uniref:adenosylcobinamide amidohydrolase n=1 Tax=Methanobrevibacter ruminantium TaxID=83816 RepID=UPI0026E944D7|nr:adenosylcobinamide amidohydrolase [Methanobrevibacter ruminantium]MDO5841759.1 adenosylcobinamide amidohydrolase [Methanobrevibacter ruminantium]
MPIDDKNQEFELIMKTSDGDEILKNSDTVLVRFGPKRNGIVSSWLNGGYNEDLSAVFNHQLSQENIDKYGDGGILDFLKDLSTDFYNGLDLRSDKLSGLITSADMNSYSIACEKYRDIEVIAITTAGARVNAVSAGDLASYYEINADYRYDLEEDESNGQNNNQNPNKPGTINTILLINTKLDESSLLLAEMIAVEAKAVALRDLMVSSNYSDEIATGTGTDGIAIFSNMESENFTDNVSKHAKIGELIGKVVIDSIKEALAKLQWLTPTYQLNALVRLDRFQYNLDEFYNDYLPKHMKMDEEDDKRKFIVSLIRISKNPELVSYVSLIIHLLDQYRYGLLSKKTVLKASNSILDNQLNSDEWQSMKLLLDYIIKTQLE